MLRSVQPNIAIGTHFPLLCVPLFLSKILPENLDAPPGRLYGFLSWFQGGQEAQVERKTVVLR